MNYDDYKTLSMHSKKIFDCCNDLSSGVSLCDKDPKNIFKLKKVVKSLIDMSKDMHCCVKEIVDEEKRKDDHLKKKKEYVRIFGGKKVKKKKML